MNTDISLATIALATGAVVLNTNRSEFFFIQANGNITSIALPAAGFDGQMATIIMRQNSTGAATWPSTIVNAKLAGGSFAKTLAANAVDVLKLCCVNGVWFQLSPIVLNIS